jgi:hypothetical protein
MTTLLNKYSAIGFSIAAVVDAAQPAAFPQQHTDASVGRGWPVTVTDFDN